MFDVSFIVTKKLSLALLCPEKPLSVMETIDVLTHGAPPRIAPELVDIIFAQLSPSQYADERVQEMEAAKALSRCARACRAFHLPALKVLWRDRELLEACSVLPTFTLFHIKPDPEEEGWDDDDDENGNEDWFDEDTFDALNYDDRFYCYVSPIIIDYMHHLMRANRLSPSTIYQDHSRKRRSRDLNTMHDSSIPCATLS